MAAYNAELYIREAIESVLAQSWRDFELIVVNDCSKDSSQQIADEYAKTDSRIRVISHEKNGGVAAARNTGLFAAQRPWIVIQDSDDTMMPERLATYVRMIAEQPDVIAWAGDNWVVSSNGERLYIEQIGSSSREAFDEMRCNFEPTLFSDPTFAYRRDLGVAIGGYNPKLTACDLDFMDRLSDHGVMLRIPEILTNYRVHGSSTTQSKFQGNILSLRYVYHRRQQLSKGLPAPTYEEFLEWFNAQPAQVRKQWERVDLSRMYRAQLPQYLGRKQYVQAGVNLIKAAIYHPGWFVDKVGRTLQRKR
jgi:glycosyltransferase involved in cell wall biosynthesis